MPEGVDRAVRRVNKGEKCRVLLKGRFGYGLNPPADYNLPPNAEIEFTLFLPDFEKASSNSNILFNLLGCLGKGKLGNDRAGENRCSQSAKGARHKILG